MKRFAGEPPLDEIFADPVVLSLMRADGIDPSGLRNLLATAATATASLNIGIGDGPGQSVAATDHPPHS